MPAEPDLWQSFARLNKLTFIPARFPHQQARVVGHYSGYDLSLSRWLYGLEIILTALDSHLPAPAEDQSTWAVEVLQDKFLSPRLFARIHGYLRSEAQGQKLLYHQTGELDGPLTLQQLQRLLKLLSQTATWYRHCLVLGAEAIPILQSYQRPFNSLARQLLNDIANLTATTQHQLSIKLNSILCANCLVRFQDHKAYFLTSASDFELTYYGCRYCRQSRNFFEAGRVIAVLDKAMPSPQALHQGVLRVNWLVRRSLFDFDRVEISQASDEEVERFAVQVGNDTDPGRSLRYRRITCAIAPTCHLSENTQRILRRLFEVVERHRH